jgi:hypothetical protein
MTASLMANKLLMGLLFLALALILPAPSFAGDNACYINSLNIQYVDATPPGGTMIIGASFTVSCTNGGARTVKLQAFDALSGQLLGETLYNRTGPIVPQLLVSFPAPGVRGTWSITVQVTVVGTPTFGETAWTFPIYTTPFAPTFPQPSYNTTQCEPRRSKDSC